MEIVFKFSQSHYFQGKLKHHLFLLKHKDFSLH